MISVVLNVYKRPYTLEKQIEAIKNQSIPVKPENIHIWYNRSDVEQKQPIDGSIKTYVCNWNTKFFGRFTLPLLINTPYIAMFDDDVYPQRDWFKNCLDSMEKQEGLYGGSGVVLHQKAYRPHHKFGWNGPNENIERVDLVGHAWFFKQDWIKYMWYEKPFSWENGEDIMFSYLIQKYGGINTFVPPHPHNNMNLWCSTPQFAMEHGNDNVASFKQNPHYGERNLVCSKAIDGGWKTVRNIQK